MTTTQHPLNRHLFITDNLDLLRSLDNESINLICIDPPFAKNQTWSADIQPPLRTCLQSLKYVKLRLLSGEG